MYAGWAGWLADNVIIGNGNPMNFQFKQMKILPVLDDVHIFFTISVTIPGCYATIILLLCTEMLKKELSINFLIFSIKKTVNIIQKLPI